MHESKVCIATTLREPLQQTLDFVYYHLNGGIDLMILFFDDPEDPAIEILQSQKRVKAIACNNEYWNQSKLEDRNSLEVRQDYNTSVALDWAKENDFQWIIHIDCDELVYPLGILKSALAQQQSDTDIVRFSLLEAAPQREQYQHPFSEITLFKRQPNAIQRLAARVLNQERIYYYGKFLIGHRVSKIATRVSEKIQNIGIHHSSAVEGSTLNEQISKNVYLLHYDCCGLEAFTHKWARRIEGYGVSLRLGKKRVRQLEEFTQAYEESEQAVQALYNDIYQFNGTEIAALKLIGMLKSLQLEQALFAPVKE